MSSRFASIIGAVAPIRTSLFVIAGLVAVGGSIGVVRPDRMLVERVEFVGQEQATPAQLRHLADLQNGTRMWEVDLEKIARGVSRHPWVRAATVRKMWPDKVQVTIEEYEPVALLHLDRPYYLAEDGTAFVPASLDRLDFPQVTGVRVVLGEKHPQLPELAVRGGLQLLRALDSQGLVPMAEVDELNFSTTRGYTVYTGSSEIRFAPGRTDEQVARLATLVSLGQVDLDRPTLVDLGPRTVAVIRDLSGAEG